MKIDEATREEIWVDDDMDYETRDMRLRQDEFVL